MAREPQSGILDPVPAAGLHLTFDLRAGGDAQKPIKSLCEAAPRGAIVALGPSLLRALGADVPGMRVFPGLAGTGVQTPSTQNALWVFLREASVSDCFDAALDVQRALGQDFVVDEQIGTFVYRGGHDLSGYEDGTENPQGDRARETAIIPDGPLAGSSFAALQRWLHDLPRFATYPEQQRDSAIGRRFTDNVELPDAPVSAHVQRSAQESYEPPAFILRRSMPWSEGGKHGLYFLAFGTDLDRFERILRRMVGLDDGVVDGLFSFTRPLTGGYYWCPPVDGGRLVLPG
ncbi:MAG: Dyp-type peroxidase [Chloroflexi bacterium]|nr:Dyp-type peroxidase [Chloroflexota bacterium]